MAASAPATIIREALAEDAPLLAQLRYHYAACALALEEADATCDIARMWVDVTSTRNAGSAAGFRHQLAIMDGGVKRFARRAADRK